MPSARLLIVEDDEDMLYTLRRWCSREGYEVHTASDGIEAFEKISAQAFDLVVLDLHLPRLSGDEVLSYINTKQPEAQVIILTGYGSMEAAIATLGEHRAFQFLTKPLDDFRILSEALARALAYRRRIRSERRDGPPDAPPVKWSFTPRERDVARLLTRGMKGPEIAKKLNIKPSTVRNYLNGIYEITHSKHMADAIAKLKGTNLG